MNNPISYNLDGREKYTVWVSYWGVEIMKYFSRPEEAIDYVKQNSHRCRGFKSPATQDELDLWLSELSMIPNPEGKNHASSETGTSDPEKPSKIWLYALVGAVIFVINYIYNPEDALITLISSITQVAVVFIVLGFLMGIKRLFRRDK